MDVVLSTWLSASRTACVDAPVYGATIQLWGTRTTRQRDNRISQGNQSLVLLLSWNWALATYILESQTSACISVSPPGCVSAIQSQPHLHGNLPHFMLWLFVIPVFHKPNQDFPSCSSVVLQDRGWQQQDFTVAHLCRKGKLREGPGRSPCLVIQWSWKRN